MLVTEHHEVNIIYKVTNVTLCDKLKITRTYIEPWTYEYTFACDLEAHVDHTKGERRRGRKNKRMCVEWEKLILFLLPLKFLFWFVTCYPTILPWKLGHSTLYSSCLQQITTQRFLPRSLYEKSEVEFESFQR